MEDGHFEVLIVGTGLTESITAAALSKAGFKVAHVDSNPYYGAKEASLSLDELVTWLNAQKTKENSSLTSISWTGDTVNQSRQYAICLRPSIIPSIGPVISSLISSGVSRYGGFRLLEHVGIYDKSQTVKSVPGTKEDVFKTKDISLIDKRRLMRFLMFAVGEFENDPQFTGSEDVSFPEYLKSKFSLNNDITSAIVYALSFSQSDSEPTRIALPRLRKYLRSAGRYGPSPFLVGHYGGTGEIAQGFCRAAAVSGGVYILGREIESIKRRDISNSDEEQPKSSSQPRYEIGLADFPEKLTADIIVASTSQHRPVEGGLEPSPPGNAASESTLMSVARCVAIINKPIYLPSTTSTSEAQENEEASEDDSIPSHKALDAGVIIFPPSTVNGGSRNAAATLLVTGEGSMSTPAGKWILYITLPVDDTITTTNSADEVLQPYLDVVMALTCSSPPQTSNQSPEAENTADTSHDCPLFSAFYYEHHGQSAAASTSPRNVVAHDQSVGTTQTFIISPALPPSLSLPESPDVAATNAEVVFWEVVNALKGMDTSDVGDGSSTAFSVESFWPPLDSGNDSDGEDGW